MNFNFYFYLKFPSASYIVCQSPAKYFKSYFRFSSAKCFCSIIILPWSCAEDSYLSALLSTMDYIYLPGGIRSSISGGSALSISFEINLIYYCAEQEYMNIPPPPAYQVNKNWNSEI